MKYEYRDSCQTQREYKIKSIASRFRYVLKPTKQSDTKATTTEHTNNKCIWNPDNGVMAAATATMKNWTVRIEIIERREDEGDTANLSADGIRIWFHKICLHEHSWNKTTVFWRTIESNKSAHFCLNCTFEHDEMNSLMFGHCHTCTEHVPPRCPSWINIFPDKCHPTTD